MTSIPCTQDFAPRAHRRNDPLPAWKRTLDVSVCVAAVPLLGLATAFVTLWLVLVSPGPVLFRQERMGLHGRRFWLYKFRTMRRDADAAAHHQHVAALLQADTPMRKLDAEGDQRLIPGARLIRALAIDELPQLLNVWRREMSIVGPRPCIPFEYDHYTPEHRARFNAVPGLTGLWQVSGKNSTTFNEMIRLDVAYSETKSLRQDLVIILRTPRAVWDQLANRTRKVARRGFNPRGVSSLPTSSFSQ